MLYKNINSSLFFLLHAHPPCHVLVVHFIVLGQDFPINTSTLILGDHPFTDLSCDEAVFMNVHTTACHVKCPALKDISALVEDVKVNFF